MGYSQEFAVAIYCSYGPSNTTYDSWFRTGKQELSWSCCWVWRCAYVSTHTHARTYTHIHIYTCTLHIYWYMYLLGPCHGVWLSWHLGLQSNGGRARWQGSRGSLTQPICMHYSEHRTYLEVYPWGPFYKHSLNLNPAWISNYTSDKVGSEIAYPNYLTIMGLFNYPYIRGTNGPASGYCRPDLAHYGMIT